MFSTSCPQCGAAIEFRSAAAVMAVCAFCRSTLLRRGADVARIGELATVLDDASPVQIGTAGRYGARAFTVLGRIQLTWEAGAWSEWYVVFDDGAFGWLSDASGQYAITVRVGDEADGSGDADEVGASGASGAAGASNAPGASGLSGANALGMSGTSGASGASGAPGASGLSGVSGTSSASNASGMSGTSGASGASGAPSASGLSGAAGMSSASNTSNASGMSGTSGAGASGALDTSGQSGASGASGFSSVPGTSGASRTSGSPGASSASRTARAPASTWPAFRALRPGMALDHDARTYMVSDVRTARCTGGDGELPFRVDAGWQARVADLRTGDAFMTLDYSDVRVDGDRPARYEGRALPFDALAFTGLRDTPQPGRAEDGVVMVPFACPSCGAPLAYAPNVADYVVCASCHAGVRCTAEQQTVFSKRRRIDAMKGALEPGATGTFDGAQYTVIGMMRCKAPGSDDDDDAPWDEYLLLNPRRGFLWLVHSADGWERVDVLDAWPTIDGETRVTDGGNAYRISETYDSQVVYVVGAFSWRVQVGDRVSIADYVRQKGRFGGAFGRKPAGAEKLTRERSREEIVWSRAQSVSASALAECFGMPGLALATVAPGPADRSATGGKGSAKTNAGAARARAVATASKRAPAKAQAEASGKNAHSFAPLPLVFSVLLVGCNLETLFSFSGRSVYVLLGLLVLWLPEWLWKAFAMIRDES